MNGRKYSDGTLAVVNGGEFLADDDGVPVELDLEEVAPLQADPGAEVTRTTREERVAIRERERNKTNLKVKS